MLETSQKLSRLEALMKALKSYLPQDKYTRLLKKSVYWENESIWEKLNQEIAALNIPKDPTNDKCVAIYAYLNGKGPAEMKAEMLQKGY